MSGKNVAIVLAVSEYQSASRLAACKTDGALIRDILAATGRFTSDNIFFADTETDGDTIKTKLPKFIEEVAKRDTTVDEVFFYFSGHGTF